MGQPKLRVIHPFLMAAWPILSLWAANVEEVLVIDVVLPLGIVLIVSVALFAMLGIALKDQCKAGLIVTCFVVFAASYQLLYGFAGWITESLGIESLYFYSSLRHRYVFFPVLLVTAVLCVYIALTHRKLISLTRFLNAASICLVLLSLVNIGGAEIVSRLSAPRNVQGKSTAASSAEHFADKPDIYYIIFDRYASRGTLSRDYDFNNEVFLDHLTERGFYLANESRSNYPMSMLSLWTALNMRFHSDGVTSYTVARNLRIGHEVGSVLKSMGYCYFHIGGSYNVTNSCRQANQNAQLPLGSSEFSRSLMMMTPLPILFDSLNMLNAIENFEISKFQFRKVEELAKSEKGPKLVFAHILLPHPPFVFMKDGKRRETFVSDDDKGAYIEQLQFTNSMIEKLVDTILENSAKPPIIVLQADEGPYLRGDDDQKSFARQVAIRSGILNAIYLPDKELAQQLYPSISTVNTFRVIFNTLGKKYELLEDRVYVWGAEHDEFHMSEKFNTFFFRDVTNYLESSDE